MAFEAFITNPLGIIKATCASILQGLNIVPTAFEILKNITMAHLRYTDDLFLPNVTMSNSALPTKLIDVWKDIESGREKSRKPFGKTGVVIK